MWFCEIYLLLKLPIPVVFDLTGFRKCFFFFFFFVGKCLTISQKLRGGDRKQIEVCKKQKTKQKSQNRRMSCFSSLCQPTSLISHNWSVWLIPCFVGVHHICVVVDKKCKVKKKKYTIVHLSCGVHVASPTRRYSDKFLVRHGASLTTQISYT